MDTTAKFLFEVERFLRRNGMNASEFGRDAVGDSAFVLRLRRGRSPSGKMMDKVREYMRKARETT